MSDALDKFVLQYRVDADKATQDLSRLQKNVEATNKAAGTSEKGIARLAKQLRETTSEVKGLSGSMGSLAAGASRATPVIAGMAAGALALASAYKLASNAAKDLNAQSSTAAKVGTGTPQVAMFQAAMGRASGGRVSALQSRSLLEKMAAKGMSAYTDPTQNNRDAIALRAAGVSINGQGGRIASPLDQVMQLSKSMAGMGQERAQALGLALDLEQKEIEALRQLGGEFQKLSGMTELQAQWNIKATQSAKELDGAYGRIESAMSAMGQEVGSHLLPAFTGFVDTLADLAEGTRDAVGWLLRLDSTVGTFFGTLGTKLWEALKNSFSGKSSTGSFLGDAIEPWKAAFEGAAETYKKGGEQASEKTLKDAEKVNAEAYKGFAQFNRDIQTFSSAVSAFGGAIDERQAWAAWAGEVGKAAGITHPMNKAGSGSPGTASYNAAAAASALGGAAPAGSKPIAGGEQYEGFIQEAAKLHGIDPNLIKRVMRVESGFDPKAVSGTGAQGLMQLMPSISKAYGIADPFDPRSNIMGGTRLLSENLARAAGDPVKALLMYHGGLKESNWGPLTRAYPGKVLGSNFQHAAPVADAINPSATPTYSFGGGYRVGAGGENRNKAQLSMVQQMLAGRLRIPLEQLQQGGVSRGDVAWAASQQYSELTNGLKGMRQSLNAPGLTEGKIGEIQRGILGTEAAMSNLRNFAPGIMEGSREGGRSLTIGEVRIQVAATPGSDGQQLGRDIGDAFKREVTDVLNQASTGIKF